MSFRPYPSVLVPIRGIGRVSNSDELKKACDVARRHYERHGPNVNWHVDVRSPMAAVRHATLEHIADALSECLARAEDVLAASGVHIATTERDFQRACVLAAGLWRGGFHVLMLWSEHAGAGIGVAGGGTEATPLTPDRLGNLGADPLRSLHYIDVRGLCSQPFTRCIRPLLPDDQGPYIDLNERDAPDQVMLKQRIFRIVDSHDNLAGTGFFIGPEGLALTALHVLAGCGSRIHIQKDESPVSRLCATVKAEDPSNDIAILQVTTRTGASVSVPYLPVVSHPEVTRDGLEEKVAAHGYVHEPSVTFEDERPYAGYIGHQADVQFEDAASRQRVSVIKKSRPDWRQDSRFMKGSSGGPVMCTATGSLVGIIEGRWPETYDPDVAGYAVPLGQILAAVQSVGTPVGTAPFPMRLD